MPYLSWVGLMQLQWGVGLFLCPHCARYWLWNSYRQPACTSSLFPVVVPRTFIRSKG